MIEVILPRWIRKYLDSPKKCSEQLRKKFIKEMVVLYEDVEAGEVLVGDLTGYYKIDFTHVGTQYRIIYTVRSEEEILVVYCGTRENATQKSRGKH